MPEQYNRRKERFPSVAFTINDNKGNKKDVTAIDASENWARFSGRHKKDIIKAKEGTYTINNDIYEFQDIKSHKKRNEDVVIVEFDKIKMTPGQQESLNITSNEANHKYRKSTKIEILLEQVSRIHLYEAKQRFIFLRHTIKYYDNTPNLEFPEGIEVARSCIRIAWKSLMEAEVLLSRRQQDLNILWREMTLIHCMLLEKVIPTHELASQCDFCCEQAKRLHEENEPEIGNMLLHLADIRQEHGNNRKDLVRGIKTLLERFSSIRTGRIHEQFINIRTYQKALLMLAVLILILFTINDFLIKSFQIIPDTNVTSAEQIVNPNKESNRKSNQQIHFIHKLIYGSIEKNLIMFVFFGGFIGGFF